VTRAVAPSGLGDDAGDRRRPGLEDVQHADRAQRRDQPAQLGRRFSVLGRAGPQVGQALGVGDEGGDAALADLETVDHAAVHAGGQHVLGADRVVHRDLLD
jgi:hypothetical protein